MEATDSPVSSAKVSALGKALDQASISSGLEGGSPAAAGDAQGGHDGGEYDDYEEEEDDDEFDDDDDDDDDLSAEEVDQLPVKLPAKSPKKRGRTDSMKKALPPPASQRYKHLSDSSTDSGAPTVSSPDSTSSSTSKTTLLYTATAATVPLNPQSKLMVKDRKGSGMGTPNVHLILDAVKQAPPAKEKSNPRRWSKHEDESLRLAVERSGERNWKAIADQVPGRNHTQCLQRWTKVLKPGLIKGHWTPEEDSKLRELVAEGKKNWGQVASLIPGRTSKQCRERWCNHLDPNINKGSYTEDEDKIIIEMQAKLGNRWSIIAQQLKGRTEDAVKIRWKSLMRGRRAALKEDKATPLSSSASSATSSPSNSTPTERPRPKTAKSPSARPKPKLASGVKAELEPVSEESANASLPPPAPKPQERAQEIPLSTVSEMARPDFSKPPPQQQMMHQDMNNVGMGPHVPMQNANDVAASIHNFRMSQQFHPNLVQVGGTIYAGNPNMMGQQQHPVGFSMPNGAYGMPMSQQQAYQLPPGYVMSNDTTMVHGYVVPNNYAVSGPMQVPMQMTSGSVPPGNSFVPQSMGMGMSMGMVGGQGAPMSMASNSGGVAHQGIVGGNMGVPTSSAPSQQGPPMNGRPGGVDLGLPPASAASAARVLNTPREEWGSSQTPRSQMMMAEGHASAYELFHQQRLRLMMKEREKQGLSLVSAPSPGQALLTKELEANKERQAIMQKGWKSAVDAMISVNSINDLASLDDQQRFDSLLEKVTLSALDPTDEELLDLTGEDTIDL